MFSTSMENIHGPHGFSYSSFAPSHGSPSHGGTHMDSLMDLGDGRSNRRTPSRSATGDCSGASFVVRDLRLETPKRSAPNHGMSMGTSRLRASSSDPGATGGCASVFLLPFPLVLLVQWVHKRNYVTHYDFIHGFETAHPVSFWHLSR